MVKVYNWEDADCSPENPKKNDMYFGIGLMNSLLLELTDKMNELLTNVSESDSKIDFETLEQFNESTLGRQIRILKSNYDGIDLSYTKLEQLRKERNYFLHNYHYDSDKPEAQRLFNLIRLITKVYGQSNNANQRVVKKNNSSKNSARNNLRNEIIRIVHNCPSYAGFVRLSDIGNQLSNEGIKYTKLEQTIKGFKWKVYQEDDEHENVKYVKISEVQ